MNTKNNRLVSTDERNLQIYQSLPAEDFKEFMMAYLTYVKGDDLTKMISNPLVRTLFMTYIERIEYNEDKWQKSAEARRNNGKKGGRKKKNNQDMQPNAEFDSEPENIPNKTVITAEYPNPQPKAESPSEGQESGKNEVLEIKSSVPDVDDSDNDFRYAQTDPYENPELSFLLDDDEFEKFEEEMKNNEIIHKIICKDMDGNVNAEYVDDIVMVLKKAIKDGIVDWSAITDGVNSISQKYRKSKMEVDGLIKMVLSDMQAA